MILIPVLTLIKMASVLVLFNNEVTRMQMKQYKKEWKRSWVL